MTQFQPPPAPPAAMPGIPGQPVRWSAAAITGFVGSLLGCTLIGALIGIVFGIIGIMNTRGGRRRGMGLAIAALPISLASGFVGLIVAASMVVLVHGAALVEDVGRVITMGNTDVQQSTDILLNVAGDDLQESLTASRLQAWVEGIAEKQGSFVEMSPDQSRFARGTDPNGDPYFTVIGKFVNGEAAIKIVLDQNSSMMGIKVADIEVDGMSLRDPE